MDAGRIFLRVMRRRLEGFSYQAYTVMLGGALCSIGAISWEGGWEPSVDMRLCIYGIIADLKNKKQYEFYV